MQYMTTYLDDNEDPTVELNDLAVEGWKLIAATNFVDEEQDDRGYSYKTRKIRYIMEKPDA